MQRLWIWCCLVMMLLTGCGGGSSMSPAKSSSSHGGSTVQAESSGNDSAPRAPDSDGATASVAPAQMAPSPSAGSGSVSRSESRSADRSEPSPSPTPTPRERPGLGTEFGETRSSRVHDVAFVRSESDRPFAVAALHYNDRRGVEAMAAYHANQTGARFRDVSAANGAITVSIHDESGAPLEAVHMGDRTFVMGAAGQRYSIVLTNHTGHRFESVATVDGLDVINGRPGTLDNRGYVLMPYATLEIDGFRQSHDAVAAFRFAKVADSYAAQTGSARNVGVIGVAFFNERGDRFDPYSQSELHTRETASPFPGADPRFAQPPR
jgi:hypothetical protein